MFRKSGFSFFEQPYLERSAEDYTTHTTRMPVVESAVYRYPNGHRIMIREESFICEQQRNMYGSPYNCSFPSSIHQRYRAPEAQKKVHFVECDKATEIPEKKADNEDDSFIQRNQKNNMYGNRYKYNFPSGYRQGSPAPEAQKKAHFVEHDKTTEASRKGKHEVPEEKVDDEADSFIKRKHKNFELAKMDTFKVY